MRITRLLFSVPDSEVVRIVARRPKNNQNQKDREKYRENRDIPTLNPRLILYKINDIKSFINSLLFMQSASFFVVVPVTKCFYFL